MYSRYVALGDSFTEGLDDALPGGAFRGWADLVAASLAALTPGFRYANLGVRSRRLGAIRDEQLAPALAMEPDLVTVAAGANDIIGFRCDIEALGIEADDFLARLAGSGARVVGFTGYHPHRPLPFGRLVRGRLTAYNELLRGSFARHGVTVVDLERMTELYEEQHWSVDRLHLSTSGHAVVARAVLAALGQKVPATTAPELVVTPDWRSRRRADLDWARTYFWPWIGRRLTGRSTGDQLGPKRPQLTPWAESVSENA